MLLFLNSNGFSTFYDSSLPRRSLSIQHQMQRTIAFKLDQSAPFLLKMSETSAAEGEDISPSGEVEEAKDEDNSDDVGDDTAEDEEEEKEAEKEDPEITALKSEISSLENQLKSSKKKYSYLLEEVEDFSEKGYLRKCADMDNVRRLRDMSFSNDRLAARASAVQNFIPILDELTQLSEENADVEFAKAYSALKWNLESVFEELEVTKVTAAVGDKVNKGRMAVVGKEYSDSLDEDTVMKEVKPGLEIKGNVMQLVEVVISLGSEEEAKKREAEKKAKEEEAKAKLEKENEAAEEEEAVKESSD